MSAKISLDIEGKGFEFDGNSLTTAWDENTSIEKRDNGLYLYDVTGGIDNWTIVAYDGDTGIRTNDEVVQYIYAFSRFPVDENYRTGVSLSFLTDFEKSCIDVINEVNWLHEHGYPQRSQWLPKERDLMMFKGIGIPLDIRELYGDLINKTCEDGLRYPDSVCEALFVIEKVEYSDSESQKLPIRDMDIRCLWSSENCNVKPGDLLPKYRTKYEEEEVKTYDVIGNFYAFDFVKATFPPYNGTTTKANIDLNKLKQLGDEYFKLAESLTVYKKNPTTGKWTATPNSNSKLEKLSEEIHSYGYVVIYTLGVDNQGNRTKASLHLQYSGNKTSNANGFYDLFEGSKKSIYENNGNSFGDIFTVKNETNKARLQYMAEQAVDYDPETTMVTMHNGYKFPLWYLRHLKYHEPVDAGKDNAGKDFCYVLCPDHYNDDGEPCWYTDPGEQEKLFKNTWPTESGSEPVLPGLGNLMQYQGVDSNGIARVVPLSERNGQLVLGLESFRISLKCLIKANHYKYCECDTEMNRTIRSIGDNLNTTLYPSTVSIRSNAHIEFVECGECTSPQNVWSIKSGSNPYGSIPMAVLRTFDSMNKALVTPATIQLLKQEVAKYGPGYVVKIGSNYDSQGYALLVSMDDLVVITGSAKTYANANVVAQTNTVPIMSNLSSPGDTTGQKKYQVISTGSTTPSKKVTNNDETNARIAQYLENPNISSDAMDRLRKAGLIT